MLLRCIIEEQLDGLITQAVHGNILYIDANL